MTMRTITCAAMLALTTTAAVVAESNDPRDPRATLYNDTVMRRALADIAQMPEPELRSFTHYLAECTDQGGDVAKHACASAQTAYEVEFGRKRALDDMINARANIEPWDSAHPPNRTVTWIVEEAKKYGLTIAALHSAARERFRALKAAPK
jgi:hypothetical protein